MIKTKRNRKRKIPHRVFERRTICFSSYNRKEKKVKLWWVHEWKKELTKENTRDLCTVYIVRRIFFISMYSVLNKLSEYTYFYKAKNITSLHILLLLLFKIVESLRFILNPIYLKSYIQKNAFLGINPMLIRQKGFLSMSINFIISIRKLFLFFN